MIVADTSVLVKIVAPEPGSDIARSLRREEIVSPSIWIAEAANVFWRKARAREMEADDADQLFRILMNTIQTIPMDGMAEQALALSFALDHPAYDCFFLRCAIERETFVVTSDARFASAVRRHRKWARHVRLLDEFRVR
jgi:predicted nucleic acid-binding protein